MRERGTLMDKETLSNYGWIVICVIVLAVMISLAAPFAETIRDAVVGTINDLIGEADEALSGMATDYSWDSTL